MTNDVTTFKVNASRLLPLPFLMTVKAGVDYTLNERDLRLETRTWSFRPTFAATAPERLVGSYDLINWPYVGVRTFRNGDRVKWIDIRAVDQDGPPRAAGGPEIRDRRGRCVPRIGRMGLTHVDTHELALPRFRARTRRTKPTEMSSSTRLIVQRASFHGSPNTVLPMTNV